MRAIKHSRTMRAAGFKKIYDGGSFVTWGRGNIRIALNPARPVGLKRLIGHVITQTIYRVQQGAKIKFHEFETK